MLFRKWGCLVGPENSIFRKLKSIDPKKRPLTTEMLLHFYFPFKAFLENERERERARARGEDPVRDRELQLQSEIAIDSAISRRRDRDLREIAPSIAISRRSRSRRRSRSGAIANSDRDRAIDCDPVQSRTRIAIAISDRDHGAVVGLETFLELMIFFFWVMACVFWFVFSFFFSKHQKIFSRKFFEMQPNTEKYFPFPEISISGKYVFSEKRFTPTKHSQSHIYHQKTTAKLFKL